jgi:hypothetical protein
MSCDEGATNIASKAKLYPIKRLSWKGYGLRPKALAADSERVSPRAREENKPRTTGPIIPGTMAIYPGFHTQPISNFSQT